MPSPPLLFTAIVLAGDRGPHDPVATAAKVPCKAFTIIANKPMIVRVLETLATAESIGACILSGPKKEHLHEAPDLQQQINSQHIQWTPPPSHSQFKHPFCVTNHIPYPTYSPHDRRSCIIISCHGRALLCRGPEIPK